jgi:hypothetical protein
VSEGRAAQPYLAAALCIGLTLPFLAKPVHLDDANFLVLARGAALDPWRPHALQINWQGTTERAFDVLSNPPGIGWWLAPVYDQPVVVQHLWMLPWLGPLLLSAWSLGQRVARRGAEAMVLIGAAPATTLAACSLMPDLPLLSLSLSGMAVTLAGWARIGALLVGLGALFRFSALALVPVVALAAALAQPPGRRWMIAVQCAILAMLPSILLALHDLDAYGEVHLLAMVGFQSVSNDGDSLVHKAGAAVAMLGAALALPTLGGKRARLRGLVVGAALGALAGRWAGQGGGPLLWTTLCVGAGGAALEAARSSMRGLPRATARALGLWLLVGLGFLITLRFVAARYWLPFFAPAVLLPLKNAPVGRLRVALVLAPTLSLLLAVDDARLAWAQRHLAQWAADLRPQDRPVRFAGHWGWQHHLEGLGVRPLEDDALLPIGTVLLRSAVAWPQTPGPGCWRRLGQSALLPTPWLPRVHTVEGQANLHATMIAGEPPLPTFAPWGLGSDPYDVATAVQAKFCAVGEEAGPLPATALSSTALSSTALSSTPVPSTP